MTDLLAQARANVAARLRRDAERALEAARRVEVGEDDGCFGVRYEVARLEKERGQ